MTAATAQARYEVALQLFQAGNYPLAERTLREAVAIEPAHELSYSLLALTLQYQGRPREALGAANAALAIQPSVDALRARALAKIELGDFKGAVAAAGDAGRLMPSSPWAAHTLGWALEKSKRFVEAEVQFRRSADLAPGNVTLRAEHGRYLLRRRRLKDAEAVAAEIPPDAENDLVLLLRGEIALRRGRLDEARERALWLLSRDARDSQAIVLLTLATANRNVLLKLWWHHTQIIAFRPMWQRVLWIGALLIAALAISGLPLLLFIYLRLAQRHVNRQVLAELKQVKLKQGF